MNVLNQDEEILGNLNMLVSKFTLMHYGTSMSEVELTAEQRVRLLEQLSAITATADRFCKNVLLLLGEDV